MYNETGHKWLQMAYRLGNFYLQVVHPGGNRSLKYCEFTTAVKSCFNASCLYATVRSINLFSGLYVDRLWLKERNMGTNLPSTWPHFLQETPLWLSKYSTRLWTNAQKYNRCQSQVLGFLTLNYTGNQGFIQIIFSLTFSNIFYFLWKRDNLKPAWYRQFPFKQLYLCHINLSKIWAHVKINVWKLFLIQSRSWSLCTTNLNPYLERDIGYRNTLAHETV